MSEIVVGDVLIWQPEMEWSGDPAERDRPLTWAVTIHATVPVLPPLRGGELIVAPTRILEQLQQVEMIQWADISRPLAGQSIAGVLVGKGFSEVPVQGVPLLQAPEDFLHDAEGSLNRTITEHRAALYRLGSDLSRALSAASIGGADLDALLSVAGDLGKRDLVLLDADGRVLARSRGAPRRVPAAKPGGWVTQGTVLPDGTGVALAAGPATSGPPEAARLVLAQTLTAIETFLSTGGGRRPAGPAPGREALLADLLLGRVPEAQLQSRCRILSINPDEPLRVAIFLGEAPGFDGRLRTGLRREIRERVCMLSPTEMAVLMPESGWDDWWAELQAVAGRESQVTLARSEQQPGIARAPQATRQARATGRLRAGGENGLSVYDLLLPVWDPQAFEPGPARLEEFAAGLLGVIEQHDRERGSDLLETLTGYLAAGGSTTGAAERLQIHRNTLGYRLRRITELTGADLDNEDVRLAFGLALRIRRIQALLG